MISLDTDLCIGYVEELHVHNGRSTERMSWHCSGDILASPQYESVRLFAYNPTMASWPEGNKAQELHLVCSFGFAQQEPMQVSTVNGGHGNGRNSYVEYATFANSTKPSLMTKSVGGNLRIHDIR